MDVMARRMMMGKVLGQKMREIDTTVKILEQHKRWVAGSLFDDSLANASVIYYYAPSSVARNLTYGGLYGQLNIFIDGVYLDYWTTRTGDTRNVINANSNGIAVSVVDTNIDSAYAYIPDTGEILFAGKDTPYYGHKNISELT